ncbi:MAG: IMPACT family member YigZ [bacterium ADurb.Bin243]|nr:MAG: IMPACT family member YigZ [bacterium ADurb.Bin243]
MLKEYNTIKNAAGCELVIQKSRFICDCFKVETEKEALEKLGAVKKKYPDATHHCYAYSVGLEAVYKRHSDDGEPSGTAGMPILSVIEQNGLRGVLAVVTRYFGGVKLGAGGLVRAYSKACSEAVAAAGKVKMALSSKGAVTIDYNYFNPVERFIKQSADIAIDGVEYKEDIKISVITVSDWDEMEKAILNICNGAALFEKNGQVYHAWQPD